MQVIPITATPAQQLDVTLDQQDCTLVIYQKSTGLFLDVYIVGSLVVAARQCLDRVSLLRYPYLGFLGTLAFVDTQGTSDPVYTGLGSRFILTYQ